MSTTADGWADFNDISDGNLLSILMRHCNTYPVLGASYTLGDGDGNWCVGRVESVGRSVAHVRLDLTTWHNA